MTRHPLFILILALAVCVAVGWGLPLALDALKQALAPGGPPAKAEGPDQPAQSKGPAEGTLGNVSPVSDIPIN
jgi:hypothetical protein